MTGRCSMLSRSFATAALAALLLAAGLAAAPRPEGERPKCIHVFAPGPLRMGLPLAVVGRLEVPGFVELVQGSVVVGHGELVALSPAVVELRAVVEVVGACVLRRQARVGADRARFAGSSFRFFGRREPASIDGVSVPRRRDAERQPDFDCRAEWFVWPDHGLEVRLRIEPLTAEAVQRDIDIDFESDRQLWHPLLARGVGIATTKVASSTWRVRLTLRGGRLRFQDALHIVIGSDQVRVDPSRAAQPLPQLLDLVTVAPRVVLDHDKDLGLAFARLAARIDAERPRDELADGDFVRDLVSGIDGPRLRYTHGEFDSVLAWMQRAVRAGSRTKVAVDAARHALSVAEAATLHLIERNLARGRIRLPVQHGPVPGEGRIDFGHVFVEGALLFALATARRLELDCIAKVIDTLESVAVDDASAVALRDVAWPLRNFTVAAILLGRASSRVARDRCVQRIAVSFVSGAWPDWPENRSSLHTRRVEAWFIAGVLFPTLGLAARDRSAAARRLLETLVAAWQELPWASLGPAPTLFVTTDNARAARAAGTDIVATCCLIEGFAQVPALARHAKRWSKRVARDLVAVCDSGTGTAWDAPTVFTLCARLAWLSPALSVCAPASDPRADRPWRATPRGGESDLLR